MLALEYDPVLAREAWHEAGFEEGIEQGIDIGREQGIGIGREQGIGIARKQGIDIVAKNLLAMNFSTNDIIAATGLTAEQVRKLAETAD